MKRMIPALSFWQPYAWLIVNGYADVDSRLWAPTDHRVGSTFAVHASKRKVTKAEFADFLMSVQELKIPDYPRSPAEFDYGAVVGTAKLVKVSKNSKSYFAHRGYFHWHLQEARKIKPVHTTGQRGWFKILLDDRNQES